MQQFGSECAPHCNDAELAARHAMAQRIDAFLVLLAIVIAVVILLALWRNRRAIPSAIDNAAVTTLATGLKMSRGITRRGKRYRDRIVDKADH